MEGHIVDYLSRKGLRLGLVSRVRSRKLQILTEEHRTEKIRARSVLVLHDAVTSGSPEDAFNLLGEKIRETRAEIDCELLWEAVREEEDSSLTAMAELYFGEAGAIRESAVARAVIDDPVHFNRKGQRFIPRPAEEVRHILELRRKRAEKARLREAAESWTEQVLSQQPGTPPPGVPDHLTEFLERVHDFVFVDRESKAVEVLRSVGGKTDPRETAVELLGRVGALPEGADPFLLVNGVLREFPDSVREHVAELSAYSPHPAREAVDQGEIFSIDDSDTRDIDDAVSVIQEGDRVVVGIYIAAPVEFVARDDCVDRAAGQRALSLYLPTVTVPMLPERIGCELASLEADGLRPCLALKIRFDNDGSVQEWDFEIGEVCVNRRLTYREVDGLLEQDAKSSLSRSLELLDSIAGKLHSARSEAGAVNLLRPETKVRVSGDSISVSILDGQSPARRMISELMILANRLMAEFAISHDIQMIYRCQAPPEDRVESMTAYDPVVFDREVRKLRPSRCSTQPGPHSGLGLDAYTQITSPLRRYTDLVAQRQIYAFRKGSALPYTDRDLFQIITAAESAAAKSRNLEQESTRRWLLEYLQRNYAEEALHATVLENRGKATLAEITEIPIRGTLTGSQKITPGETIPVRIVEIRTKTGWLLIEPDL